MSFDTDTLHLLAQLDAAAVLPAVRALHLPPPPPADSGSSGRGEFCAIELADGTLGLSYVLLGDTWAQLRARQAQLALAGQPALAVAQGLASADPLARTVGLAAVNAMTRWLFDRAGFVPPPATDSLGGLDPQPGELVGMVGLFTPLVPRILARGARLLVLELREDLVRDEGALRVTTHPAELAACSQVLATGTLLMNQTLDAVLGHCRQARHLALVGPSVGGPPDPLFLRGVTLLGGSWVQHGPACLAALASGQPGGQSTRKYALAAAAYPGWPALLARLAG